MFQVLLPLERMRFDRGGFIQAMHERGIGVGVHYPAMHLFKLYRKLGYNPGDFPRAERIGSATVTLPLFPGMVEADVDRVCNALAEIVRGT
jgi:dTDP-4-amino-4,6-dideoxygalactose transaminase